MAIEWLRCGHHVYIVSTWWGSRAANTMLYHLLLFIEKRQLLSQKTPTKLHFLQYDVKHEEKAEKAVNELLQATIRGVAYVIADEVNGDFRYFGERLVTKIPDVHIWVASCYHADAPYGWQMEHLTRPLRSPPVVVREVEQSKIMEDKYVLRYSKRRVPDHTDGPPVTQLYHGGQGHSGDWPINCVTCGREVARVLHSLRVGVTDTVVISGGTTPACLQWRDVLVLYGGNTRQISGLSVMTGLREAGIPVRVMDDEDVEDVATARSDVVWMTNVERVLGLERKVIVHLVTEGDVDFYDRLQLMSRCTSQLLIVSPSLRHTVTGAQALPVEATESGSVSRTTQGTKTSSSPVSSTQLKEPVSSKVLSPLPLWDENLFPDLQSRAYFLPPAYVSRRQMIGQEVQILHHEATKKLFFKLDKMSKHNGEVLVGISRLKFGLHLNEVSLAATATQLLLTSRLPDLLPRNSNQGDTDVLFISRYYGVVVCEVKAIGDNKQGQLISEREMNSEIKKKLQEAALQLDEDETMLSRLVRDIAPGLPIIKTIVFPNITARQVQQAISRDTQLTQTLSQCLGSEDPSNICGLCLCSDDLSDPMTPWDDSSDVRKLTHWWRRRVTGLGVNGQMTCDVYKALVARFCGPATTVTVPCTCPPRVSVKTLGQAVWWTGQCYTAVITLFPEQVHLLHTAPPVLFVTGPPGTGKTVMLLLMAIEWLRCGHHVYIVSTWWGSRAANTMLYHLLFFSQKILSQLHFLQYDVRHEEEAEKAVNELLQATIRGVAYVIADEVNGDFKNFGKRLVTKIPDVHVWAASCYHGDPPAGWQMEYLTRPLRSPPAVVREVEQSKLIEDKYVLRYSKRRVPDHTDGPPVRRLYHGGQGHSGDWPINCVTCGREVARVLHSLRVGVKDTVVISGGTTPACLQWRDVLVLYGGNTRQISGLSVMTGLTKASIPVRVMEDEDINDVAKARSDVVWITNVERVLGLERKVIVHLVTEGDVDFYDRLQLMSRCTSQLLIVSPSSHHAVTDAQTLPVEATGNEWYFQQKRQRTCVEIESGSVSRTTQDTQTSSSPASSTQLKEPVSSNVQSPLPQCDEFLFPDLQTRAYFLPPAYVSHRQMIGQEVQILHHEAAKKLFLKLDKMSKHNGEVLVGISRLKFGLHLNEVSLAATATQLLLPTRLPDLLPRNSKQGDTDVLLISRYYGVVVCEVKAIGDNKQGQRISEGEMDTEIRKKLQEAALQLDEDEAMLSDLVSDIVPGLPIIKTIVFPNITARQVQQAISGDTQLTQTLSQCLGSDDPSNICGLCLCSDDLSDSMTPRDDSSDVRKLRHWWRRRVAGLVNGQMTCDIYQALVGRPKIIEEDMQLCCFV
ncbi:uncharacterized protein LOC112569638 [Pomacea canaliculata]|uniref:uncharacterized protein LOC112569638 n=1 Tax=Pomacea canaliculata TaxID=400727 RepID=UPI000D72A52B|nr:uncharacterized protein LOC112569638 [Pomacea canaliculata]